MLFDPKSAKKAGKISKRGPAKKDELSIKEKMELLYEKVLDDLLVNQEKLTKTERVKVFVTLSNYIFPKTKSVRDQFTIKQYFIYNCVNKKKYLLHLLLRDINHYFCTDH